MRFTLLFSLLFLIFQSEISAQETIIPGSFEWYLNGNILSKETLSHQVFCMDGGDSLSVVFVPESADAGASYVFLGVELWAQLQLGKPGFVGKTGKSPSAAEPSLGFQLNELETHNQIPDGLNAIRSSLRIRQLLKVSGNRILKSWAVTEKDGNFPLALIKNCGTGER